MKHLLFAVLATAALIAPVQAHVIDVCKVRSSDGYANARILPSLDGMVWGSYQNDVTVDVYDTHGRWLWVEGPPRACE
jgi:hypothetical protein